MFSPLAGDSNGGGESGTIFCALNAPFRRQRPRGRPAALRLSRPSCLSHDNRGIGPRQLPEPPILQRDARRRQKARRARDPRKRADPTGSTTPRPLPHAGGEPRSAGARFAAQRCCLLARFISIHPHNRIAHPVHSAMSPSRPPPPQRSGRSHPPRTRVTKELRSTGQGGRVDPFPSRAHPGGT